LGYPLPPCPRQFLAGLTVSFPTPSPDPLRNRVHPLVRFVPLQSSPIRTCPGLASQRNLEARAQRALGAPSLGLPSLFATSARGIVATKVPPSPPSVLGVSHALDGFIRHWPCGFISPRCHVQGSTLQGFPLPAQPSRFITDPCPLVGWPRLPTNGCPFAPASSAPPSGLCSVPGVRCACAGFTRRTARFPHGLSPPPGFPSPARWGHLHVPFRP